MKLLHGRFVLMGRLGFLYHHEMQRLITNLVTAAKVSPHRLRGGETTEGQRDVNLHAREQDSPGTDLLTQPARLKIKS